MVVPVVASAAALSGYVFVTGLAELVGPLDAAGAFAPVDGWPASVASSPSASCCPNPARLRGNGVTTAG